MENNKIEIVEFDNDGNRLGSTFKDNVDNPNWQNELSELSFKVTRLHGTERAFSLLGYSDYRKGVYRCICCENALFLSDKKYNSYTG